MAVESYLTFNQFASFMELTCTFSTRKEGYSTGSFSSQNMGNILYDNPKCVKKNRLNYYKNLNIDPNTVILADQIHSANITTVNSAGIVHNTDALISNKPNLYLGILTADCFPVFLYDPETLAIGIIHAGWRGAIRRIIPNTITQMKNQLGVSPNTIIAGIGPGLQKECFEVRKDVFHQFSEAYWHKHPDPTKRFLDLHAFIRDSLTETGIQSNNIESQNSCTKCCQSLFYSYRRDGKKSGRMMGLLGISR